jgi:hypothetical protein
METLVIMNALYRFAATNSTVFPTNLLQVLPIIEAERLRNPNLPPAAEMLSNYLYISPVPHSRGDADYEWPILIEKPGHYRRNPGSYVGFKGNTVAWRVAGELQVLVQKRGIDLGE